MKYYYLSLSFLFYVLHGFTQSSTWKIYPPMSKLAFITTHQRGAEVLGYLNQFAATFSSPTYDVRDASLEFMANMYSLNSSLSSKDQQLMAEGFLNVAKYPVMTYKSTAIIKVNVNTYRISGLLQLHGVAEYVPLIMTCGHLTFDSTLQRFYPTSVEIRATIDRQIFKIGTTYSQFLIDNKIQLIGEWRFVKSE